jgi:hypothetical protein
MNIPSLTAKVVLFALVLPAVGSAQLYRWVDENGKTHFGDKIPPEYANQDRDVLSEQGIVLDRLPGGLTEEQRAELDRIPEDEEARKKREQRDRMLLQSYSRVENIEAMRDRRLAEMDALIGNTEASLADSRTRLAQLERNASSYKPYSKEANAREMPTQLAANIGQTTRSVDNFAAALAGYRSERETLVETFAKDIQRFKELKGL